MPRPLGLVLRSAPSIRPPLHSNRVLQGSWPLAVKPALPSLPPSGTNWSSVLFFEPVPLKEKEIGSLSCGLGCSQRGPCRQGKYPGDSRWPEGNSGPSSRSAAPAKTGLSRFPSTASPHFPRQSGGALVSCHTGSLPGMAHTTFQSLFLPSGAGDGGDVGMGSSATCSAT